MLAVHPTMLCLLLGSLHSNKSTHTKKMTLKNSKQENLQYLPSLEGHMINMGTNTELIVAREAFSDLGKLVFPFQRFYGAEVFQLRGNVINEYWT